MDRPTPLTGGPPTATGLIPGSALPTASEAIQAAEALRQYQTYPPAPAKPANEWKPAEFDQAALDAAVRNEAEARAQDPKSAEAGFVYDEASGYYYDAATGYFYDASTKLYYHQDTKLWY